MRYLFILLLVCSCSVNYHLNKAIKKGYRCDTITDTIRVIKVDSFLVKTTDTIYWEKYFTTNNCILRGEILPIYQKHATKLDSITSVLTIVCAQFD